MKEAIEIFNNYYEQFDSNLFGIRLKYDHTMRVVNYAEQIAKSIDLSDEDIDLAKVCALYHDISRFKQYTKYKTFEDDVSFDHGDQGYMILKELGINDEIILNSTKYHNKYKVEDSLDDRTKLFCNITRDADKLDIMISQAKECNDEELNISDEIMECFKNHTLVKNGMNKWSSSAYHMIRCLAFVFDLNFKESYKIIKENDVVNKKCDNILSKFDDDRIKEIRDIVNNYIDQRISD